MDDREAYEFYADPAHLEIAGPRRKHPKDQLTRVLSVRISPSLLNQVTAAAAAESRSAGSWVRRVLRGELQRQRAAERPRGLIGESGRAGQPKSLPSSLRPSGIRRGYGYAMTITASGRGRTFSCPHMSVSNVASASCEQCGPLEAVA